MPSFLFAILIFAGLIVIVHFYAQRLAVDDRPTIHRWFWLWIAQGLGVPLLFWILWNLGYLPAFPPLLLHMAQAQLGGSSLLWTFCYVTGVAMILIASFWTAVSFGWLLIQLSARD